jgi:outer membrane protein assembly factor BamB
MRVENFISIAPGAWARHTLEREYYGYQLTHMMQPLLFGDFVVQGNANDGIVAYDKSTGHVKWRRSLRGGVEGGASVYKETVYFGANDGFFYAVDAYTGRSKWTFPLRSEGLGRPLIADGIVYFMTGNNMVYALNADTGEQVWLYSRMDPANLTVRGASEPTILGQSLLLGFSDGFLVALNKSNGSLLWERRLGTNVRFKDVDAKPIVRGDRVYISSYDGLFYCLSAKDGSTLWTSEDGGFQSPHVHEDKVFLATSDSRVVSLDAASGKKIWDVKLNQTVASTPVYYRGLVIFGEWQGDLVALDALTGKVVDRYSTGRGLVSPLMLDYDAQRAYIVGTNGDLYAFRLSWQLPSVRWEWEKSY